ncbi:MAG TPA: hypothetical protein VES59_07640 [Bacteroidota bacterium]|nr:hypothetical protein [Bacteroidota bacterium]
MQTCLGLLLLNFAPGVALAQADSTPDAGAVPPAGLSDGLLPGSPIPADEDSFQLKLLEIDAERFRLEAEHANLWHRLIPAIHLSAGFGLHNVLVTDPATLASSMLPKDAYRLTIGISLNDILDGSKQSAAELELKKIDVMHERDRARRERSRFDLGIQLKRLDIEKDAALQEQAILEEILRFDDIRFGQGKIGYDAFMQSRLRLVDLKKRLKLLDRRSDEIQNKLPAGGAR